MNSHQLINQTSKKTEWYTDPEILAAARQLMGGIDLDPASSAAANKHVQATAYFTAPAFEVVGEYESIVDDEVIVLPVRHYPHWGGLHFSSEWRGRVWLNHPFGQPEKACQPGCTKKGCIERDWHTATDLPGSEHWIEKLYYSFSYRIATEAVCLTFSATSEAWFQPLKLFPQIHISPRLNYYDEAGNKVKGVTKGSCLTYLGENVRGFAECFAKWGVVQVPYRGKP